MTYYPHLKDIYITKRLKDRLLEIPDYRITTIIAPTGYGKTIAVKYFRTYSERYLPGAVVLSPDIVSDSRTEFWKNLCRLFDERNPDFAEGLRAIGFPQDRHTFPVFAELLNDTVKYEETPFFIILDDVHLLPGEWVSELLLYLSEHLSDAVHLILVSRGEIFSGAERMKLGRNLCEIAVDDLRLTQEEICEYAAHCGLPLSVRDANKLYSCSEGWISFIYLLFCSYAQSGVWRFDTVDIYRLIDEIMLDPLTEEQRQFLTLCSVSEVFTPEQASYLWQQDCRELLEQLCGINAFIVRDSYGAYRYHFLLRQNTKKRFGELPLIYQREVLERLGDWNYEHMVYLPAMIQYYQAEAWEKLLNAVICDGGNSLFVEQRELVRSWCAHCPDSILYKYPEAVLLLALECFANGDISEMLRLNEMLLEIVQTDKGISDKERDNYLGDSQILLGFLTFNDISAMSEYHRKACVLLSRTSRLVNPQSPWTFGAPSVLMLYHSMTGALDKENGQMCDCMPYYYQISDGHGSGAEYVMQTETEYIRGNLYDAEISYHLAARSAGRKEQWSVYTAAEFAAMRIALLKGDFAGMQKQLESLRQTLKEKRQFVLFGTVDMCQGWLYALLEKREHIPAWILEENAADSMMPFVAPTVIVIRNQALLVHGAYASLIAYGEEYDVIFTEQKMILCRIYLHIQLAAALEKLQRRGRALEKLRIALELAMPDGIVMPFAENGGYIRDLLETLAEQKIYTNEIEHILTLADCFINAKCQISKEQFGETEDYGLTDREMEVARLAADRKTIKEISYALCLSENTVKTHLKHVYDKLGITGTDRCKRAALEKKLIKI